MYLTVILLPCIICCLLCIFGRKLGYFGVIVYCCINMCFLVLLVFLIMYEVCVCETQCIITFGYWLDLFSISIVYYCLFDPLACVMLVVVVLISFLTQLFSVEYMNVEPHRIRFCVYLVMFTFFMEILVTAGTLLQFFIGWEGVGISSYVLIAFWYTRIAAAKAAALAIIVNKIGDIAVLCGIAMVQATCGTIDFLVVEQLYAQMQKPVCAGIALLFVIGALAKSAQVGLHLWLPEAMEGPTPVSALIHAATMVTAGIYLLCRIHTLLYTVMYIRFFICIIGACTILFGALLACVSMDIKKVIAYSTCSQLGYMLVGCGMQSYTYALYHLVVHAFFKALLFLCAGYIIHAIWNEQDMRYFGGMYKRMSFMYVCIGIGVFALIGFPMVGSFFSKEVLVQSIFFVISTYDVTIVIWCVVVGICLSSIYMVRLYWLLFYGDVRFCLQYVTHMCLFHALGEQRSTHLHDLSLVTCIVLWVLAFCSIVVGYMCSYYFNICL